MSQPLTDVISVKPLTGYRLFIVFEDGASGEVDLGQLIKFEGIFASLKEPTYFATVKVSADLGTICWDNGADIAPEFLREHIQ